MSSVTHNTCPSAMQCWCFWASRAVMEAWGDTHIPVSYRNQKRQSISLLPCCMCNCIEDYNYSISLLKNWNMATGSSCNSSFSLQAIKDYNYTGCTAPSCTSPFYPSADTHPNPNSISCSNNYTLSWCFDAWDNTKNCQMMMMRRRRNQWNDITLKFHHC
jgi:hypothetical protein